MVSIKPRLGIGFFLFWLSINIAIASPTFLVNSDWLTEHQDNDKLVILEVRYHPHRYYTIGHIDGAHQVQRFKDLTDSNSPILTRFPDHLVFQQQLRDWGINDDSLILIYDDSRTVLASRLYFMLELYGFNMSQVKILNGGLLEWSAFEELSQNTPPPPVVGNVTLQMANPDLLIEWTTIYDRVISRRDPNVLLVDVRPFDQYTGKVIQHSIRGGHIPGAINVVSLDGTDSASQEWLSDAKVAALYQNVDKNKTIYLYCHDGFRTTLAYLQLKHLGYSDVKLYNGGWGHWGNELSLPVVQGEAALDDDFLL